jgi:protein-tyrosine-phosphatase
MPTDRPGAVLFACNINAVRSPMAEALMKLFYGFEIYVDSCGVAPRDELDPFVVEVIDELGGDLSHHRPKAFDDLTDTSFDLVVSLTPEAHHRALQMTEGRAMEAVYWPTPDPTLATGSRDQILDAYRQARDHLKARILDRFGHAPSVGG